MRSFFTNLQKRFVVCKFSEKIKIVSELICVELEGLWSRRKFN